MQELTFFSLLVRVVLLVELCCSFSISLLVPILSPNGKCGENLESVYCCCGKGGVEVSQLLCRRFAGCACPSGYSNLCLCGVSCWGLSGSLHECFSVLAETTASYYIFLGLFVYVLACIVSVCCPILR